METDSVPADKADKAADPAEETERSKKNYLEQTKIIVEVEMGRKTAFNYNFVAKKFSKKQKRCRRFSSASFLMLLCFSMVSVLLFALY